MYHFIVNPNARSGKGIRIWNKIKRVLEEKKVPYERHMTEYAGHAVKISKDLTNVSYGGRKTDRPFAATKIIVVLGGDGTLNEVVNGLCSMEGVVLGYIPTGSGNDFARSLGISSNSKKALDRILQVKSDDDDTSASGIKELDYGIVKGGKEDRRFMVSAGIGFDAAVCHKAVESKMKNVLNRLRLGKLTYLLIALKQLFLSDGSDGFLVTDDGRKIEAKTFLFASAQNHPYEGGGFLFCPDADPSDGVLDVCLVNGMPKIKFLRALPLALKGKHIRFQEVTILRCKEFQMKTRTALPIHTDGEPFGYRDEVGFQLGVGKIKVIT